MKKNKYSQKTLKHIYYFCGSKYKIEILYYLSLKNMRFSDLKVSIGTITQQLLTKQLRKMEKDLLITRKDYGGYPRKVEYSLANLGKSLIPIIQSMQKWENINLNKILKILKKNHLDSLFDYY